MILEREVAKDLELMFGKWRIKLVSRKLRMILGQKTRKVT